MVIPNEDEASRKNNNTKQLYDGSTNEAAKDFGGVVVKQS